VDVRYNFDVNNTTTPWHLVDDSGHVDHSYTWGPVTGAPITDTLWNARTDPPIPPPIAAGEPYTKNMQAYAIYGPINMLDYASAFISVTYAMDTLDGDLFGVAYSTDGTEFTWLAATSGRDPALSMRRTDYYPIPTSVRRQPQVWLALVFTSQDRDDIDALGIYVEDVILRALPAYKVYLPIIRLDPTPTPTLTPTPTVLPYLYNYTFDVGGTSDPDFVAWGGNRTTGCGTNCSYAQTIVGSGNPGGALTLYMAGQNRVGGSSPATTTSVNYELSTDFYLFNGQVDARYSLIFNATAGTFPDNHNPPIQADRNYYKLKMRISEAQRDEIVTYQLQKCTSGQCAALNSETNLPAVIRARQWHTLKIKQENNNITLYLNNSELVTVPYDSSWGDDRRRFGVYIETRQYTDSKGQLEIFFDNVRVKQLP
jgi:hypothetical protein